MAQMIARFPIAVPVDLADTLSKGVSL